MGFAERDPLNVTCDWAQNERVLRGECDDVGAQRLEIATDERKRQPRSEQGVSPPDRTHGGQADDGIECIARQGRLHPTVRVGHIG